MKSIGFRVLRIAAIAVGAYFLVLVVYIMFFENAMIFFPQKGGVGPSPGEDVYVVTQDGFRIHGWYLSNPQARATLLWFHGNAGNLEDRRDMFGDLHKLPANVLAIDYRGFGKSTGSPDEQGVYRDARAAYDWLLKDKSADPKNIVLLGESLGGAVASELATQVPVAGVILQSTFTSAAEMAAKVLPFFPARWFMRSKFDNLEKVARIQVPKLFLHAKDDEVIPFEMAPRLLAAAAPPKESAWLDKGGHNGIFVLAPKEYYARLAVFLESVAGRPKGSSQH